jgi:hypothetical protein
MKKLANMYIEIVKNILFYMFYNLIRIKVLIITMTDDLTTSRTLFAKILFPFISWLLIYLLNQFMFDF